jgi:hypothetical protein
MRYSQLYRLPVIAVMFLTSLLLAGGVLFSTAGPATAAPGGTNVCSSLTASVDLSAAVPAGTGTLSGCHQQGSGAWSALEISSPGSSSLGSISWQTGHATSVFVLTLTSLDFTRGPCPAGDIAASFTMTVESGPYEGSNGGLVECAKLSHYPIVGLSNFGLVII